MLKSRSKRLVTHSSPRQKLGRRPLVGAVARANKYYYADHSAPGRHDKNSCLTQSMKDSSPSNQKRGKGYLCQTKTGSSPRVRFVRAQQNATEAEVVSTGLVSTTNEVLHSYRPPSHCKTELCSPEESRVTYIYIYMPDQIKGKYCRSVEAKLYFCVLSPAFLMLGHFQHVVSIQSKLISTSVLPQRIE